MFLDLIFHIFALRKRKMMLIVLLQRNCYTNFLSRLRLEKGISVSYLTLTSQMVKKNNNLGMKIGQTSKKPIALSHKLYLFCNKSLFDYMIIFKILIVNKWKKGIINVRWVNQTQPNQT